MSSASRSNLILAVVTSVTLVLMLALLLVTRTTINLASVATLALLLAVQLALVIYCRVRGLSRLRPVVETTFLFLLINLGLLPITYAGMRLGLPIADDWLSLMDHAMGFDWRDFVRWIDERPVLALLLFVAYSSFVVQLLIVPAYFALTGSVCRANAMVAAYAMIVIVSTAIGLWFPSEGTFHFYGIDQSQLKNIDIHFAIAYLSEFDAVRSQPTFEIRFDHAQGLLTFPSVHVACAALCTWAAWGSRYLWMPVTALNALMAVSAISHGGHFAVDAVGGLFVAMGCVALSNKLFRVPVAIMARVSERVFWREITEPRLLTRDPVAVVPSSAKG
jgi:hypothetical protein